MAPEAILSPDFTLRNTAFEVAQLLLYKSFSGSAFLFYTHKNLLLAVSPFFLLHFVAWHSLSFA